MKDAAVKRWSRFHRRLYRYTGGLVGRRLVDNDMLILTTSGRASGRPHAVPLLYLQDGGDLVVIASYGGRDRHPDWYLNLVADPSVTARVRGRVLELRARTASAAERHTWWPRVVAAFDGYAAYQSRTTREIPVVILEPVSSASVGAGGFDLDGDVDR
jgi:deazaflavin-dependent oxidoreductase (nitroreductase family)